MRWYFIIFIESCYWLIAVIVYAIFIRSTELDSIGILVVLTFLCQVAITCSRFIS